MHFLGNSIISIFSVYLAFTNTVADQLTTILTFASQPPAEEVVLDTTNQTKTGIEHISSAYTAIPKILLENAAYQGQNASVIDATTQKNASTPIEALANIYCTYKTDTYIRATTGTGYFIDTSGIILTNAHVGQFLLLEGIKGSTKCIIRTGNPAVPMYEVELLYISPAWIQKNAKLINQERPQGTGERDYALLYVTAGLDGNPMPQSFPALPFNTSLMTTNALGQRVYAAGYPAETAFHKDGGDAKLIPKLATTSIKELMTFGSNYADIFSISGTDIGEQGSSGGPVVDDNGVAIGMISTRGDDARFGKGSLRAITLSYIDRTIQEETGFSLTRNLGGNLPFRAKLYKDTMVPFLRQILQRELNKQE